MYLIKTSYIKKTEGVYHKEKYSGVVAKELVLKESDPLFGVLREDQVGINPATGRLRIAEEVHEAMRQYLLMVSGSERKIREDRVKSSVAAAKKDPVTKKIALTLEPNPIVSSDLNKGKGLVFGYAPQVPTNAREASEGQSRKLLAPAIRAGNILSLSQEKSSSRTVSISDREEVNSSLFQTGTMVCGSGFFEPGHSGTSMRK